MMTEMTLEVMEQVKAGLPLAPAQQRWVIESHDIVQLGMVASEARARVRGDRATFVRVDVLPFSEASEWDIAPDAGEVRLTGAPADLSAALAAVTALTARASVPVTAFSVHELALAAGRDLAAWCTALRAAGLAAVALARADQLDEAWLEDIAQTGLSVNSLAPGWPVTGDALLALLQQVRGWQARYRVFRAYQPLALDVPESEPSTGFDDMRATVAARLVLDNVDHLQVSWTRAGAKLSQACLLFGADDIDDVPARDPLLHGPRRSVLEEVRRNLRAVSLVPVERTGAFHERPATAPAGAGT